MSPAPSRPWWAERDGVDHRPPAARGKGARRGFGATWWGRAWVEALETRARLDLNRLPRGRGYARRGTVADLVIVPGAVTARVQGSRARPYDVTVTVPTFTGAQWDQVLDAIAAQLGRAAALLDGQLPPELAADVASTGLDLLPGAGEVRPRCSCPDYADPCKHAAAVCYLVADALDADPFALLLLRGRSREQLATGLRARRGGVGPESGGGPASGRGHGRGHGRGRGAAGGGAAGGGRGAAGGGTGDAPANDPRKAGVLATAAYARQDLPALPAPSLPPARPGPPAVLPVDPPPSAGVTAGDLARLAAGAAERAWALARGEP